jgi:zinc/manganese transport system substrate-binding protein
MLDAIGLDNVTPAKFSEAVENDTDVAPAVLMQTLDLFRAGRVKVLVYNAQSGGPQTRTVVEAAKKHGVPAVPVTETLPRGASYLDWMTANLAAIGKALGD